MTITVYGAGAIGGTIGAHLARAGVPILLVDSATDHVAAISENGLTVLDGEGTFTVPVEAVSPDEMAGSLGLVLLAVKAQHTADAVHALAPRLGPDSAVVSLQNGLCERVISDMLGEERTVGCFVNFSADYLRPGVIAAGGPGSVYVGELDGQRTQRIAEIRELLSHCGPVSVTDNIWGYLWSKLGYANMLFATALADETMADVIERFPELMIELATEVYEVAEREGVRLEPFDDVDPSLYSPRERRDPGAIRRSLEELVARRRRDPKTKSGIWRDIAVRKRKTEVDQQIGLAAQIGEGYGLAMPLTRRLVVMIHELEEGSRIMQWANLEELEQLRAGLRDC
jgi:2-dehydropantoate 2-reductase